MPLPITTVSQLVSCVRARALGATSMPIQRERLRSSPTFMDFPSNAAAAKGPSGATTEDEKAGSTSARPSYLGAAKGHPALSHFPLRFEAIKQCRTDDRDRT